jgi:hypothetical protein
VTLNDAEVIIEDLCAQLAAASATNSELSRALFSAMNALSRAKTLAWEVGTETDDGVHKLLPDSRGNLWREIHSCEEFVRMCLAKASRRSGPEGRGAKGRHRNGSIGSRP